MSDDTLQPNRDAVNPRRRYRSSVRREQARATRARILDASSRLFVEQGYVAATIEAIAAEAAVSPQTVYSVFGTKRQLLKEVMDVAIGGDDRPVDMLERAGPQRMRQEPDQRRQLRMMAAGISEVLDRAGPLFGVMRDAAAADGDIAEAYHVLQETRLRNMANVVEWVGANGPLRSGLTESHAADIVWTLTSADVHRMLRVDRDWPPERYERWLAESLIDALLP